MKSFPTTILETLREPTWWAWLATGGLLLAGLLGSRSAFAAACLFALGQYVYFAAGDDSRLPHAAQVRLAFALILVVADAAGLLWLCWAVLAGTALRVAFGYCLLGRMLLALRSDLGLLSEEYDPRYGRQVGNTPQAFSHVPLIQAALNLEAHAGDHCRRTGGRRHAARRSGADPG